MVKTIFRGMQLRDLIKTALIGLLLTTGFLCYPSTTTAQSLTYSCDQLGLEAALLTGGGPHTFNCSEPTIVTLTHAYPVTKSVILDGAGLLTFSGGDAIQIFQVSGGAILELRNLTLAQGKAENGGAISVQQAGLILDNTQIMDSQSIQNGGAIFNSAGVITLINGSIIERNQAGGSGGGIYNTEGGLLTITGSRLSDNSAAINGGAILNELGGQVTLDHAEIQRNSAFVGGGGLYNQNSNSQIIIQDSLITANSASFDGGAIYNTDAARVAVTGSVIRENSASNAGAALYNDSAIDLPVSITESCILNTVTSSITNTSSNPIEAQRNWWGALEAPVDTFVGSVDTTNFLTAPGNPAPDCQRFIGGFVWLDQDNDGEVDVDELGISGVTILLIDAATGESVANTQTNASGNYGFINLTVTEGSYLLQFEQPDGLLFTSLNIALDPNSGQTEPFTFTADMIISGQNVLFFESIPTPTITPSPTFTASATQTLTPTVTPSETPTLTPTVTPSETPTLTPTVTPSETPTLTPTVVPSETPTLTPTVVPSETPTLTPTVTPSLTPSPTITPSPTATIPPSLTPTPIPAGILLIGGGEFTVTEGSSASYELVLNSMPAAPITLRLQGMPDIQVNSSETVDLFFRRRPGTNRNRSQSVFQRISLPKRRALLF